MDYPNNFSNESYSLMDVSNNGHLTNAESVQQLTGLGVSSRPKLISRNLFPAFDKRHIHIFMSAIIFILTVWAVCFSTLYFMERGKDKFQKDTEPVSHSNKHHYQYDENIIPKSKSTHKEHENFPIEIHDITEESSKPQNLSITTVRGKHVRPGVKIFSEEFNDFNLITWQHSIGASEKKFNLYVNNRTNSFVKDGKLYIKPTLTVDHYGEEYLYNGSLFLGTHPNLRCLGDKLFCWKPNEEQIVHPIMSAMIGTEGSFSFAYGIVEIRAKIPGGDWLEPMLTLQPKDNFYGPLLLSGQVHLVDIRGNRKLYSPLGVPIGSERNCPDLRFGTSQGHAHAVTNCINTEVDKGFDRDFHIYRLEWTPEEIIIKIDDKEVVKGPSPHENFFEVLKSDKQQQSTLKNPWMTSNFKVAPFDKEFYLIIALAVGGTSGFFDDSFVGPYTKPWSNRDNLAANKFWEAKDLWLPSWEDDNSSFQLDYIRIWSLNTTIENPEHSEQEE